MHFNVVHILGQLKIDFIIFCIRNISVSGIGHNIFKISALARKSLISRALVFGIVLFANELQMQLLVKDRKRAELKSLQYWVV